VPLMDALRHFSSDTDLNLRKESISSIGISHPD
jgi:hypothetical protein